MRGLELRWEIIVLVIQADLPCVLLSRGEFNLLSPASVNVSCDYTFLVHIHHSRSGMSYYYRWRSWGILGSCSQKRGEWCLRLTERLERCCINFVMVKREMSIKMNLLIYWSIHASTVVTSS